MRVTLFFVVLGLAAVLAVPALGKEGVRATLDRPVKLDTPAGKTMRVLWHLSDGEGNPFGAGGIYLRVSRCGAPPLRIRAKDRGEGHFSARFTVPKRGVRKLMVGL